MRNDEVKIIFVDIDFTVLWHDKNRHTFDKHSLKALRRLQERYGIKVVISTGRPYDSARVTGIFNYINPDAIVSCNGTNAIVKDKIIYSDAFPKEVVKNVIDVCANLGLVVEASSPLNRYFSLETNEFVKGYMNEFQESVPMVKRDLEDEDINALLVFAPAEYDDQIYSKLNTGITGYRFASYGIDIRTHNVSKADGVKAVMDYFGFTKEQAMSIGDSDFGDSPMFALTKYSVAMGNASDGLKEKAYFVTKHVKKHGLKYALKKLNIL